MPPKTKKGKDAAAAAAVAAATGPDAHMAQLAGLIAANPDMAEKAKRLLAAAESVPDAGGAAAAATPARVAVAKRKTPEGVPFANTDPAELEAVVAFLYRAILQHNLNPYTLKTWSQLKVCWDVDEIGSDPPCKCSVKALLLKLVKNRYSTHQSNANKVRACVWLR